MIQLNDKANGEQTMNDTRINTSEEQTVKALIWLGEKIRRMTADDDGHFPSELAIIIQDAVLDATDHLKDKDGNSINCPDGGFGCSDPKLDALPDVILETILHMLNIKNCSSVWS